MAIDSNRLAGVAYITVDGVQYMLAGDLSYSTSLIERKTLTGQDGVHGFSEMPHSGFISGTLRDAGNLSVSSFNAMQSVSVLIELANGKRVTGARMWCVDAQEVKTVEGTFEVKFEGRQVQEI